MDKAKLKHTSTKICQVCGKTGTSTDLYPAPLVRPEIAEVIKKQFPNWDSSGFICVDDLKIFRSQYIRSLIEVERGEISELEHEVVESLDKHQVLSSHVQETFESQLTFGERLSDRIASFGGSWKFIILFGVIIFLWMVTNAMVLATKPFDPYPFILLNLVLSCLAALQAPVIMMSQNRQEAKDRLRSVYDYQVNLKAELEIRQLHQKVDHLLRQQWDRLMQIQEIQLDLMDEIRTLQQQSKNPSPD